MTSVRRALVYSFIGRYGGAVLQLVNVMVLARLLTPSEIGIYTLGVAIVSFVQVFRDFGISGYIIQEKDLTRKKIGAALGLTTIAAFTMGAALLAAAGPAARIYQEPGVADVLIVLSVNFFLLPVGGLAPALLRRDMSFGILTKIRLLCTFVSVFVGVALALQGYGFMCMAWASVASATLNSMLCLKYLPNKYRTLPSLEAWRDVISISGYGGTAALIRQAGESGAELILGRVLGVAQLGFYSRAAGYIKIFRNYFLAAVMPVAHSKFARTHRASSDLCDDYLVVLDYTTVVSFSAYAFLAILSLPIIRLLFGDQWDTAAPIASLLCLAGCFGLLTRVNNVLLTSIGKTRIQFLVDLLIQPLKLVLVLYLAMTHGLEGAAFAIVVVAFTNALISTIVVLTHIGQMPSAFFSSMGKSSVVAAVCSIGPYLLLTHTNWQNALIPSLMIAGLASAVCWITCVYVSQHPIMNEYQVFANFVNRFLRKK